MPVEYRPRYRPSVGRDIGRVSAECRPSVGRMSVECRSSVDRLSTDTISWVSVEYRPRYRSTSRPRSKPILPVEYRPTSVGRDVDRVSAETSAECRPRCWPIVSVDYRPTLSVKYRLTLSALGRYLARYSTDISADSRASYRPILGGVSAEMSVEYMSVKYRPRCWSSIGRVSASSVGQY